MTRIEEERLAFEFGEQWNIFKFDEHHDYRQGIAKLDKTKAVDFLGIIGCLHSSSDPEYWQPYVKLLCTARSQLKVVLWLEENLPAYPRLRQKAIAATRTKVFKQKLTWLTKRVIVCGSDRQTLPDVIVSNLPTN